MYLLLDKWDAAELFNKTIAAFDKKDAIENLISIEKFTQRLENYRRKELSKKVNEKIFGFEKVYNKETNTYDKKPVNPTAFYEFCRQLYHGEPVVIPVTVFDKFKKFIKEKDFGEETVILCNGFSLNQKQRNLENTKWVVYFYDDYSGYDDQQKAITLKGISLAIIILKPFGKAEIVRPKTDFKQTRIYTGTYRVCKNDEYLAFKMKIKETKQRDLRILFYIGTDKINLALGLSVNNNEDDYVKTVMIEPLNESKSNIPGFYSRDLPNELNKEIPNYVWEYFQKESLNYLTLPHKKITSVEKLIGYLHTLD